MGHRDIDRLWLLKALRTVDKQPPAKKCHLSMWDIDITVPIFLHLRNGWSVWRGCDFRTSSKPSLRRLSMNLSLTAEQVSSPTSHRIKDASNSWGRSGQHWSSKDYFTWWGLIMGDTWGTHSRQFYIPRRLRKRWPTELYPPGRKIALFFRI